MRVPPRTRLTLALACLAACGSPDPPARPAGPDWNALRRESDAKLVRGDSAGFRAYGPLLLRSTPDAEDADAWVQVALNTAQAWRGGAYADPYPLLIRADSLMRTHPSGGALYARAGERLAGEFLAVRLPWRADAVLRRIPPPWVPVGSGVAERVAAHLSERREALAALGAPAGGDHASATRSRLLDLLAIPPAEGPFEEPDEGSRALTPDEESYAEELASLTPGPFLLSLYGAAPPPPLVEGEPRYGYLTLEGPDLPAAQRDAAVRLHHATRGRSGEITDAGALRELAAGFADGGVPRLESVHREGEVLLVSFWTADEAAAEGNSFYSPGRRDVLVVYPGPAGTPIVRHFDGEGALETALRDLTGDGRAELLVSERSGSGGFLDVDVVDLAADRVVWTARSLYQGGVSLVDVDADPESEILSTVHAGRQPSRLLATLFDYRASAGRFVPIARGATMGAYWAESSGPFGLGPHTRLRSLETLAGPVLDRVSRGAVPAREELDLLLGEYYATLLAARQYGKAAQVMDQLARGLERLPPDTAISHARDAAIRHRLLAIVRGRGAREGLRIARDPALRRAVAPHPDARMDYLNITSVAAMAAGDFDQAYQSLVEESTLPSGESSAHHGNLSWYLRQVGAFPESYDAATRALGAALADGDHGGAVADMFHLARAALSMDRAEEALDWVSRAVGLARGVGDRESAAAALAIGAEIALRRGFPDVALRLLDEAVLCMDADAWGSTRAALLLGYAQALDASGRMDAAERAYRAAAGVAERAGSPDRVAALHGLSRLAERRGDAAGALAHAESAFAAVVRGRLSIGAEPHKFSFLGDKEVVAERLFGLARRRGADPAWLLDAVEQSKMQVFLDLYGAPDGVRDRRGIARQLQAGLLPGDLLLDYVVGDSVSFVLSVSRDGVRVHDLPVRRPEARELVRRVHAHMDLTRSGALRAIRRDRPPRELRDALRRLHAVLLDGVPLPLGTRRLVVVPDGSLAGLPWAALLDGEGRALVERLEVSQLPSVPLALDRMRQAGAAAESRPRALVVGALQGVPAERVRRATGFGRGAEWTPRALPPLAGGGREAATIGRALQGMEVRYLVDSRARPRGAAAAEVPTPANVLASLPSASLVHFIAHGVFNARAPMRSVLFLQADSAGGTFAAADFLRRPLPGLQLVVLSACQTGVSGTMPGGEPVGFVRGVLGAGAASVVLTEWEVDDAATADLFGAFYTHLRTDSRSGALRRAQLQVMRRRRHPFYWAGVTLHGDWRALQAGPLAPQEGARLPARARRGFTRSLPKTVEPDRLPPVR